MDLESLWTSACSLLENRMNYLAYTTWVKDNMFPVNMEGDTVIVVTTADANVYDLNDIFED